MSKSHLPDHPTTRGAFIWKVGILRWGGMMFVFFSILGPLISHFTTGKALTLRAYVTATIISAIIMIPAGALFGWLMWLVTNRAE